MTRRFSVHGGMRWLLMIGLLAGGLGLLPSTAFAFGHGHHGGGHVGWGGGHHGGGHFVHRPAAHYYHRGHVGFHGNYNSWSRYGGYGYAPNWRYGYGHRWNYGLGYGYGVGYRGAYRGWNYGPVNYWNPCFSSVGFGYGWNWPTYYSGSPIFWNVRPFVPAWRTRVRGVWGVPFVDADAAPAWDVDGIDGAGPVRLAARGPVPMPPDDASGTVARDLIYPLVRESSAGARHRAEAYVELGDKLFRKGQHHAALAQYKLAATASSDWGAPYYRQAVASIAVKRYDEAAALMRRAVKLDARFVRGDFRLATMYGDRAAVKVEHQEALAASAMEHPDQPELVYLVGVLLHFDGETARAQKFLAHAVRLRGDSTTAEIAAFLLPPGAELAADFDL